MRLPRMPGRPSRETLGPAATGDFFVFSILTTNFSTVISPMWCRSSMPIPDMHAIKVGMEYYDPIRGYILPPFDPRYQAVVFSSACNVMIRRESFHLLGGFSTDPAFREAHGGEDAAFCAALAEHLPPLGKVDRATIAAGVTPTAMFTGFWPTPDWQRNTPTVSSSSCLSDAQSQGGLRRPSTAIRNLCARSLQA